VDFSQGGTAGTRSQRIRVLHVVPQLGMGGTEHGLLKVIRGLGGEEFDHRICAVRNIDTEFANRMNMTSPVCCVGSKRRGFQFPLFRLARIMKEFRPHIVHSRNFGALEAIPAARLSGVPAVIHSEHGYELDTIFRLPFRRRLLYRALFPLANTVFTVTDDLRVFHAKQSWLRPSRFRVIYNGADTGHFLPCRKRVANTRKQFNIPIDRIVIGSVGRLVPIKDHPTFLQAASNLLRGGSDIHVLLVGAGPEGTRLKDYVMASPLLKDRVTFTGASDQIADLLNAMDIFVLPSICEGMSNTLLEAMASGIPVVATQAGGNSELVDEGKSGFLFPPGDAETLTNRLVTLLHDAQTRSAMGSSARQRALELFSLEVMLERYRSLYLNSLPSMAVQPEGLG
jgi:sugar transferase (PEP-CTERM/EpsH1 system associated)